MSLPKIEMPLFRATVPSTGKEIMLRPMRVREEKVLLIAKEGQDDSEISLAVKQVVNNCLAQGDVDTNKLTLFDIEYLFLKVWSISEESVVKVSYRDMSDDKVRDFEVDLTKVIVDMDKKPSPVIEVGKDAGFTMKYPPASLYEDENYRKLVNDGDGLGLTDLLVSYSIKNYFEGDSVTDFESMPKDKIVEYIPDNIPASVFKKMKKFIEEMPSLYYKIEYKDSEKNKKTIELRSLSDFFTF